MTVELLSASGGVGRDGTTPPNTHPAWEAMCDKVYVCQVLRLDDRNGELTVTYTASDVAFAIHRQIVRLGDTVDDTDVADWSQICETVIDQPHLRLGVPS